MLPLQMVRDPFNKNDSGGTQMSLWHLSLTQWIQPIPPVRGRWTKQCCFEPGEVPKPNTNCRLYWRFFQGNIGRRIACSLWLNFLSNKSWYICIDYWCIIQSFGQTMPKVAPNLQSDDDTAIAENDIHNYKWIMNTHHSNNDKNLQFLPSVPSNLSIELTKTYCINLYN